MDIFTIDLLMPHFFLEVKDINIINELGRISAAQIHFDEVLRVHALIKTDSKKYKSVQENIARKMEQTKLLTVVLVFCLFIFEAHGSPEKRLKRCENKCTTEMNTCSVECRMKHFKNMKRKVIMDCLIECQKEYQECGTECSCSAQCAIETNICRDSCALNFPDKKERRQCNRNCRSENKNCKNNC